MSETPKKLVINVEKGTQEYIDLTPAEIAERDQMQAQMPPIPARAGQRGQI